jgi:hypothetical protein
LNGLRSYLGYTFFQEKPLQLILSWEYVADDVMGGVSVGGMTEERFHGRDAVVLRGDVSLENNGGFIQIATDFRPSGQVMDVSQWRGIEFDVWGNGRAYDIRLRTDQLQRPWQSFRAEFETKEQWQTVQIPFTDFFAHRIEAELDQTRLRRVAILAIGREFRAEVCISDLRFFE